MASNVFFMDDRANSLAEGIQYKAVKLLRDAGLANLFKPDDVVGIKVHMGEHGNVFNIRPQWVRSIADEIKRLGGKPVIVECNTIPFGPFTSRAIREDHLRCASRHGFTEEVLGCPIWICDGEYGFDDVKVDIPNGVALKFSYMGKKLLELDACVIVTHFKGHPMGVFGGAIKNIGIGMGSKRGKTLTHYINHPVYGRKVFTVDEEAFAAWAEQPSPNAAEYLVKSCPFGAMEKQGKVLKYYEDRCRQCATCVALGAFGGIWQIPPEITFLWTPTIADACAGYMNAIGPDRFIFLSYAMDITPACDCNNFHDRAIIPNIGVFASKDPVAIDMACLEAVEASPGMPESKAEEFGFLEPGTERFTNLCALSKASQWAQINAAVYNGLGTSEYNLIVSEPASEYEFWFEPYTPDSPWGYIHREWVAKQNWKPEYPYSYDELRLSLTELSIKPKGKVKDLSIQELGEEE
jgi:uncharacterized Fe-S center protein